MIAFLTITNSFYDLFLLRPNPALHNDQTLVTKEREQKEQEEMRSVLASLRRWPVATRTSVWSRCLSSEANAVTDLSDINPDFLPKLKEQKIDEFGRAYGTGRRKNAVARVWIWEGSGQITVNGKSFIHYFQPLQRYHIMEPFLSSQTHGLFDVWCTVKGTHTHTHLLTKY